MKTKIWIKGSKICKVDENEVQEAKFIKLGDFILKIRSVGNSTMVVIEHPENLDFVEDEIYVDGQDYSVIEFSK